ncbi:MAG: AAA family ATPase [Gammaproteobacteria bacterium]
MHTRIIHIFGASGSGTTTLGAALAADLDVLHLDADDFYWHKTDPPYQDKVPPAARIDAILERLHGVERCVLSGSLCSWGDRLLPLFEVAILVRLAPSVRMARLRARERVRNGARIDPGGDLHREHVEFMEWATKYDEGKAPLRTLHLHRQWMTRLDCATFDMDSSRPTSELVIATKTTLTELGVLP